MARSRPCARFSPGRRPSAELLGHSDDDALRATQEAEPVEVLVLRDLADELRTVAAQAGDDVVDVVDGEHDAADAQRVRRRGLRLGSDRGGCVELRQLDPAVAVRGPHHGDVGADVLQADDAIHPRPLVRRLALQLHAELGEERLGRLEVLDDDQDVVHPLQHQVPDRNPRSAGSWPRTRIVSAARRNAASATPIGPGPSEMRATPSPASSASVGPAGAASTLTPIGSRATSAAITSGSRMPGTKMQSAPASAYARPRSSASSTPPASRRNTSVRALITNGTPSASARPRATRTLRAWLAPAASRRAASAAPSSRFAPTAPASMAMAIVSATSRGSSP